MMKQLILASGSPYRRELLERLRLPFTVDSPEIDETPLAGEEASVLARRLAEQKAALIAGRHPQAVIIGSDQVARLGTEVLGKPGSIENARSQLLRCRGREVDFLTAISVQQLARNFMKTAIVNTRVRFKKLSEEQINYYINTEQAIDCAGSFKSEGLGVALLEAMDSTDPTALIGLPLIKLTALLRDAGIEVLNSAEGESFAA